ncbi:hypothetical protein CEXT_622901 [Caerostris extrusa]|uniref:Uncharacterized protein n=1 Tax=Caerostris extrusa TaxID=172846 RepID=A0AAV4XKZ0_CAEEX|nr:hypothetical protein CEXT_622901 [Caerostris extrusa]
MSHSPAACAQSPECEGRPHVCRHARELNSIRYSQLFPSFCPLPLPLPFLLPQTSAGIRTSPYGTTIIPPLGGSCFLEHLALT